MTYEQMETFAINNSGKQIMVGYDEHENAWLWSKNGWIKSTYNENRGPDFSLIPINEDQINFDLSNVDKNNDLECYTLTFKKPTTKVSQTFQVFEEL